MSTDSAFSYENLAATAMAAPSGTAAFHSTLVPLLKSWRTPLHSFHAETLDNALKSVDASTCSLVYLQITADALKLATTAEHIELALAALAHVSTKMDLYQLEACPRVMHQLVLALNSISMETREHERICQLLLTMVDQINQQMVSMRSHSTKSKPKGKAVKTKLETLGSESNRGVRITPLHIECLKQCLLARRRQLHLQAMQTVVQVRLDAFGSLTIETRARAFMEYHLYAGMVCMGLDEFELALQMWCLVFALPARHASVIQVAAYKRLLLLNLAVNGKKAKLPSFFAGSHARVLESNAVGYVSLADTFANKSMAQTMAKLQEMQAVLESDENWGLVNRILHLLPRHFIKRVGSAYSSIGMQKLIEITGFSFYPLAAGDSFAELARYIRNMNDPSVVLEQPAGTTAAKDAIVRFTDDRATIYIAEQRNVANCIRNEQQWAMLVANKARELEGLHQHLSKLDRHLALTKEYISSEKSQVNIA
ncbi:hypothetical protein IWW36_003648 [Coemansia brasiliensis]|uniref:COP9 signalosome complex subunit 3 N-terminal helical repeats domain-containing protein n=1 Tax=Coemansia brasiliensis TaxID=2650707 RepID=A0A9W8I7E9_9FUNG|nr:hypothetical protein IWW36_003648 [Coemansia brasiliensis]